MDYLKYVSLCFTLILSLSMVSGEVAATTLTDNNLSNIIGDTPTDDDGNLNDTLIADDFTPASKIAYDSAIALNLNLLNFPQNMRTLGDMVNYYNSCNISATAVQITLNSLQPGDIVQLKNSDSAFLVYLGRDSDNRIILEDLYTRYYCSEQSFNLLFTGNAIFLNHRSSSVTGIDGSTINDNPIHDSSIHVGPMVSGESNNQKMINSFNSEESITNSSNSQVTDLKQGSKTPYLDGAVNSIKATLPKKPTRENIGRAIFAYVRAHVSYPHPLYYDTKYGAEGTLKKGIGNCCDQARVNVALCKRFGIPANYHHCRAVKFINGNVYGHVWAVMTLENGNLVTLDTSTTSSSYGNNKWKKVKGYSEYVYKDLPF